MYGLDGVRTAIFTMCIYAFWAARNLYQKSRLTFSDEKLHMDQGPILVDNHKNATFVRNNMCQIALHSLDILFEMPTDFL